MSSQDESRVSEPTPKHGCVIVMDALFGKSSCTTCGREWEALTPRGSENHCLRELGTRLAKAIADHDREVAQLRARIVEMERVLRNALPIVHLVWTKNPDVIGMVGRCVRDIEAALTSAPGAVSP